MHAVAPARRPLLARRTLLAILALSLGGVAYGGYRVISRSWSADIRVVGKNVDVIVDGQRVPADQVKWLPDGTCLVTINGATVLLDPNQPGGASSSISVEQIDEEGAAPTTPE